MEKTVQDGEGAEQHPDMVQQLPTPYISGDARARDYHGHPERQAVAAAVVTFLALVRS